MSVITSHSVASTTLTGTTGNDILNAPGSVSTEVVGFQGNDTITLVRSDDTSNAGKGDDSITLNAAASQNTVSAGEGSDSIFFSTAITTFAGSLLLGDGNDYIVNTQVNVIGGAVVGGNAGNDTISLSNGVLNSEVGGGADNDSVTIAGGTTNATITGGKGKDTVTISGASSFTTVAGSDGHDLLLLSATNGSTSLIASGGKGFDSLRLGSAIFATVAGGGLADTINFLSTNSGGGRFYGDGIGVTTAGTGTDGAADGNDKFLATKVMFGVNTSIYGAGGSDTISLADSATTALLLIDGGNDGDLIGKSTVTFSKAVSGTQLLGAVGADTIKLKSGTNKITIDGGSGADSIFLTTGNDAMWVKGGDGADTITVGSAANKVGGMATIDGGDGVDKIILKAAATTPNKKNFGNTSTQLIAKYGSGDIISLASGAGLLTATFTGINVGAALPNIFIASSLSQLSALAGAANVSATYGNTRLGNVAVFDTDGVGGTDGDLLISFNAGSVTTFAVIRIQGGDQLLLTTKTGAQAAALVDITFTTNTTKKEINLTLA